MMTAGQASPEEAHQQKWTLRHDDEPNYMWVSTFVIDRCHSVRIKSIPHEFRIKDSNFQKSSPEGLARLTMSTNFERTPRSARQGGLPSSGYGFPGYFSRSEQFNFDESSNREPNAAVEASNSGLRTWQSDVLAIFKSAVLPATKHIYHAMMRNMDLSEKELDEVLSSYYKSASQREARPSEIVWGDRKIEELLLSPTIHGKRFLRAQFQAATGAGKTKMLSEMILTHEQSDVRVYPGQREPVYLVIEPRLNLVKQTFEELSKMSKFDCFCVCSEKSVPNKTKDQAVSAIQRATRPTIVITTKDSAAGRSDSKGLMRILSEQHVKVDLLLLDEAHLVAGEAEGKITKKVYVDHSNVAMLKISFTATPIALPQSTSNGFITASDISPSKYFFCQNDATGVFGPAMYKYEYKHALADDVVLPLRLNLMDNTVTNRDDVRIYLQSLVEKWDDSNRERGQEVPLMDGTTLVDPLDASTEKQRPFDQTEWKLQRMLMFVKVLYEFAIGNQTHVVAYCTRVKRADNLKNLMVFLCEEQIRDIQSNKSIFGFKKNSLELTRIEKLAGHCFLDASSPVRVQGVEPFKEAEIGFLTNVRTVTIGTNIPKITGIFFPDIHAVKNTQSIVQSIGRGTRHAKGKVMCEIFLPCFVTSVDNAKEARLELEELQRRKTWEGSFSAMATAIYEYLEQSQPFKERKGVTEYLGTRGIKSLDIFAQAKSQESMEFGRRRQESNTAFTQQLREHRYGRATHHDVIIL